MAKKKKKRKTRRASSRTPAQRAATRKMLAANRAMRRGAKKRRPNARRGSFKLRGKMARSLRKRARARRQLKLALNPKSKTVRINNPDVAREVERIWRKLGGQVKRVIQRGS